MLRDQNIEAIAVSFINNYLNPKNERLVAEILRNNLQRIPITESAALIPEHGEFERGSTAVLNAYLTPVMTEYLNMLSHELSNQGVLAPVNIIKSNGKAMTLEIAAQRCAATFLSGPINGIVGSIDIAETSDKEEIITFDIKKTSTDIALVHKLSPKISHDNQIDAFPLRMPQLNIHTIGTNGGSIIWIGPDRTLQIGPQSTKTLPGPACYERKNIKPTISDANLLLERLSSDQPLTNNLVLDKNRANSAFKSIAKVLRTKDLTAVASKALEIAITKMAGAIRKVSVHRGFDPRDFTLINFGNAKPMHKFFVAKKLGMSEVIVPRLPKHLSTLKQMMANLRHDLVRARKGSLSNLSINELREDAENLHKENKALLLNDGVKKKLQLHEFTLDMHYNGQSFTLPIIWYPNNNNFDTLKRDFDTQHKKTFGYSDPINDLEIVNIRLVSIKIINKPKLEFTSPEESGIEMYHQKVWFGKWHETKIYQRNSLPTEYDFSEPAIVEETKNTSIIPKNWSVTINSSGSLTCKWQN